MNYLRRITWECISNAWKKQEAAYNPNWQNRQQLLTARINAQTRIWKLFEFTDPLGQIPEMLVGPVRFWQSKHPENLQVGSDSRLEFKQWKFKHLANTSGLMGSEASQKINSMIQNFPRHRFFIGFVLPTEQIVVMEGNYRGIAVALAEKQKPKIVFQENPVIAVTHLLEPEYGVLQKMLEGENQKKSCS